MLSPFHFHLILRLTFIPLTFRTFISIALILSNRHRISSSVGKQITIRQSSRCILSSYITSHVEHKSNRWKPQKSSFQHMHNTDTQEEKRKRPLFPSVGLNVFQKFRWSKQTIIGFNLLRRTELYSLPLKSTHLSPHPKVLLQMHSLGPKMKKKEEKEDGKTKEMKRLSLWKKDEKERYKKLLV